MNKTFKLALAALVMTTAACGTENRGLESVHQPVVQRTDYVIDIGMAGNDLVEGEARRLSDWFQSLNVAYGDRIAIDAADDFTAATARQSVAGVAARFGMLLSDTAPITAGEVPQGAVRVVVSRVVARTPGCPDWSRPAAPDLDANMMSNFGCATNGNIAAMVANPNDLLEGRNHTGGASVSHVTKTIGAHRGAAPSGAGGTTIKSEGVGN